MKFLLLLLFADFGISEIESAVVSRCHAGFFAENFCKITLAWEGESGSDLREAIIGIDKQVLGCFDFFA